MKNLFYILLTAVVLFSCKNEPPVNTEAMSNIYNTQETDAEMNAAIAKANETFSEFKKAFDSKDSNYDAFSIKLKFKSPQGFEHMWLSDIRLENGDYYGIIDDDPESTTEVKFGDTVKVNMNALSDWMYTENNKLRGGYSIRLIRERMGKEERANFDAMIGMTIE